ncbi:MAG: hypothetical protein HYX69_19225 [Planctomycetia bacterium]|nr:hypothetical protein [Planctomycetia bacterium]
MPWRRIVGSFLLIFGIYWAYALAAVPLIEPPADPRPAFEEDPEGYYYARGVLEMQRAALSAWFKPGDWELSSPKVIESPRGKLLLRDYQVLEDGRVLIRPCTMIFLPEGEFTSEDERNRRALILQAPEGAKLEFDTPVDLKQAKLGKLVAGELLGPVTIRSDQRSAGPEDDVWIATRDVKLIGDRIGTPHAVDFRVGPNQGSGRELEIQLAPSTKPRANSPAPNFGGVHTFTLKHDVRMRLYPGRDDIFPGTAPRAPAVSANVPARAAAVSANVPARAAAGTPQEVLPVDITCDGNFIFDVSRYSAEFHDRVDAVRINPDGLNDQLTCVVLTLFFQPEQSPAGQAPRSGPPKLEPSRVEAEGNPVIIRSPSRGVQARGHLLEYDLKKNTGRLTGPGWLKASVPDDAGSRPLEATWAHELSFRPHENAQLVSVTGNAHVEMIGTGLLNAQEIYLYLVEQADGVGPSARRRLVPDRVQAYKNVHMESPQVSGDVNHLQVWIERVAARGATGGSRQRPPESRFPRAGGPTELPPPAAVRAGPVAESPSDGPARHFHVEGELVQAEVVVAERTEVTHVHMEGYGGPHAETTDRRAAAQGASPLVTLRETQVDNPEARPLLVRGQSIDVDQRNPEEALVWVSGRPAHVEARELAVDGGTIHLDRARNVASVEGQGMLTLLVTSDLAGQEVAHPQPLELVWRGRMDFDGHEATFQDGVVARLAEQRLTADWLKAIFDGRIDFSAAAPQTRPQVEQVLCRGASGIFLERRTVVTGRTMSIERMQAVDLTVYPLTSDLRARGPGWVRSVRIGTGAGFPTLPGAQPQRAPPAAPGAERLAFLGVNFQGDLSGNQQRGLMNFQDRVRCAYGPVPDWDTTLDPDDPDKLGPEGVVLTSDALQVAQMPGLPGAEASYELTATGNVRTEGKMQDGKLFSSRAARMTYSQAKDLLVLEGNGYSDAYLSQQDRIGAQRNEVNGGKIQYWPSTRRVVGQDMHQLGIQTPPQSAPPRKRTP